MMRYQNFMENEDVWRYILSFSNVIDLSHLCRVDSRMRQIAIQVFVDSPQSVRFMSLLFKFIFEKKLENFEEKYSKEISSDKYERATQFLPLCSQLTKEKLKDNSCTFMVSFFEFLEEGMSAQEVFDIAKLAIPFLTKHFYHRFKQKKLIQMKEVFDSIPSFYGFIEALQAPDCKIQHISFDMECSTFTLAVAMLKAFEFQEHRKDPIRSQINSCFPFIVGRENQNRLYEGIQWLADKKKFSNGVPFEFQIPFLLDKEVLARNDDISEDMTDFEFFEQEINSGHIMRISQNYAPNNTPSHPDEYWIKEIFQFAHQLMCNLVSAISSNNGSIKKISGIFTKTLTQIIQRGKDIEFCVLPASDGIRTALLPTSILNMNVNRIFMEDTSMERICEDLPSSVLAQSLTHVIIAYSTVAKYYRYLRYLHNLEKLTIEIETNEHDDCYYYNDDNNDNDDNYNNNSYNYYHPQNLDFSCFPNLKTISLSMDYSFSIQEFGSAPIDRLELTGPLGRAVDLEIGKFMETRRSWAYSPLKELEVTGLEDIVLQGLVNYSSETEEIDIDHLILGSLQKPQGQVKCQKLSITDKTDLTRIANILPSFPLTEKMTFHSFYPNRGLQMAHLPLLLQKHPHVKEIDLHFASDPSFADLQIFFTKMSQLQIKLNHISFHPFPIRVERKRYCRSKDRFIPSSSGYEHKKEDEESLLSVMRDFIHNQKWEEGSEFMEQKSFQILKSDIDDSLETEEMFDFFF